MLGVKLNRSDPTALHEQVAAQIREGFAAAIRQWEREAVMHPSPPRPTLAEQARAALEAIVPRYAAELARRSQVALERAVFPNRVAELLSEIDKDPWRWPGVD